MQIYLFYFLGKGLASSKALIAAMYFPTKRVFNMIAVYQSQEPTESPKKNWVYIFLLTAVIQIGLLPD